MTRDLPSNAPIPTRRWFGPKVYGPAAEPIDLTVTEDGALITQAIIAVIRERLAEIDAAAEKDAA